MTPISQLYSPYKTSLVSFPGGVFYSPLGLPSDLKFSLLDAFRAPVVEYDGTIGSQVQQVSNFSIRKVKVLSLPVDLLNTFSEFVTAQVSALTSAFLQKSATPCGGFSYLKYESPGGHYDFHSDNGHVFTQDGITKLTFDYPCRQVSMVYYLNDDYEGGEIEVAPEGSSSILIKPKADHILLFPSDARYPHKVHPLKSGTRYAVVNWFSLEGLTDSTAPAVVKGT